MMLLCPRQGEVLPACPPTTAMPTALLGLSGGRVGGCRWFLFIERSGGNMGLGLAGELLDQGASGAEAEGTWALAPRQASRLAPVASDPLRDVL